jgi:SAM-dependent methyltransferase
MTEVNSPQYWQSRFESDWEELNGRAQTAFFAKIITDYLPKWLCKQIEDATSTIFDFACAMGDALPVLKERFPKSTISGGDIAESAVSQAKAAFEEFEFHHLEPFGAVPIADIQICSNTLEHFKDWQPLLSLICSAARHHAIFMVPYAEAKLHPEHQVSFHLSAFPDSIGDFQLAHLTIVDVRGYVPCYWYGWQMIAIYSREIEPCNNVDAINLDLRDRSLVHRKNVKSAAEMLAELKWAVG